LKNDARMIDSIKCGGFYARPGLQQLKSIADRCGYQPLLLSSSYLVYAGTMRYHCGFRFVRCHLRSPHLASLAEGQIPDTAELNLDGPPYLGFHKVVSNFWTLPKRRLLASASLQESTLPAFGTDMF
jgi:hypothetical protein